MPSDSINFVFGISMYKVDFFQNLKIIAPLVVDLALQKKRTNQFITHSVNFIFSIPLLRHKLIKEDFPFIK
jgi:hypothetical protein